MYDLIILGGGAAGMTAAERASRLGLSVIVFEKLRLGGNYLNTGCVPTKALLHSSNVSQIARNSRYGHTTGQSGYDMGAAVARKNTIIRKIHLEAQQTIDDLNIQVVLAPAGITGLGEGSITVTANEKAYHGKRLLIATGSVSVVPDIKGAEDAVRSGYVRCSQDIGQNSFVPKSLIVLGGNKTALELAQIYHDAGASVTILTDGSPGSFLPDRDYSEYFENEFCSVQNMDIIYNAVPTAIEDSSVAYTVGGKEHAASAQMVLFCGARRSVLRGYGLEVPDVKIWDGGITVDCHMRTSVPNIWAAGDCTGISDSAHTTCRQAEVAVNDMVGFDDSMRYENIPSVCFARPTAASVGLTVEDALKRGMDVWMVELPLHWSHRFQLEQIRGPGLAKLVLDGDSIVGFHMVGGDSAGLCAAALVMIEGKLSLSALRGMMFAHLTSSELLRFLLDEAYHRACSRNR